MSEYLQFHGLAFYPASNPNRDREGEPKQIIIANTTRGRISSQCLKRTWRTSDLFAQVFGALGEGKLGMRTKELGGLVYHRLVESNMPAPQAEQWTLVLAAVFGVTKPQEDEESMDHLKNETLFFISPEEKRALLAYADKIIAEKLPPPNVKGKEQMEKEAAKLRPQILSYDSTAIDLALFGRMFANDKSYSVEACCQVAHAFTVNSMEVEDDFLAAVDDIKYSGASDEDRGSGHLGNAPLGAGVFYFHVSINISMLRKRLNNDEALVAKACRTLIEAVCTQFPRAKGNSCAQQSVMVYGRVERGEKSPRNLALAFNDPVNEKTGMMKIAIQRLVDTAAAIDKVYGPRYSKMAQFNALTGEGTLKDLLDLAGGDDAPAGVPK